MKWCIRFFFTFIFSILPNLAKFTLWIIVTWATSQNWGKKKTNTLIHTLGEIGWKLGQSEPPTPKGWKICGPETLFHCISFFANHCGELFFILSWGISGFCIRNLWVFIIHIAVFSSMRELPYTIHMYLSTYLVNTKFLTYLTKTFIVATYNL